MVVCPARAGRSEFNVYSLHFKNSITGKHYIGSTNDLVRRLSEHRRGHTLSTRQRGVWEIIYTEECKSMLEARRKEKIVKSYKGGNAFKRLLAGVVQR